MSEDDANPLLEGLQLRRRPEACAIVIFGASGDLTKRKLIPALYALAYRKLLPEEFAIVGVARSPQTVEAVRRGDEEGREAVRARSLPAGRLGQLAAGMRYVGTDFASEEGEDQVGRVLEEVDAERGPPATASTTSPCHRRRSPPR